MHINNTRVNGLPVIDIKAPDGLYEGTRAITVQSYLEANSKNGTEHELSVYIESMASGQENDSILITGSSPVVLKQRTASYTGDGVVLDIFEDATYSSLGAEIDQFNLSRINPVAEQAKFYSLPVITGDGNRAFVREYFIGNRSNQGKGATGADSGRERILKPNTTYLFRVTSLEGEQDVYLFDSWYEGELDLPVA